MDQKRKETHQLKNELIKNTLLFALTELGTSGVVDIIQDLCMKIAKNGGADVMKLGAFIEAELWEKDGYEFETIKKFLRS